MVSGLNSNIAQDWRVPNNLQNGQGNKYTTDTLKAAGVKTNVEESDSFSTSAKFAVGSAALFEGIPLARYMRNNKKLGGKLTDDMHNISKSTQDAFKNIFKGEGKLTEKIGQYIGVVNQNKEVYSELKNKAIAGTKAPKLLEKAEKAAQKAAENGTASNVKAAEKAAKKAEKAIETASKEIKPATIEKGAGVLKAGNLLKSSGAGILMAFGGIIEGITEVVPTFQELGSEKGIKQLGKSTFKVLSDTAGFIAGQQAGMAIGSAIGTAVFPGVGTAIGGAVGLACGMIGSYAADKFAEKIVGKSEREIAKEQQQSNKNEFLTEQYNNPFMATV